MEEETQEEIWWELLDEERQIYYYYNLLTEETVWERPQTGTVTRPDENEFVPPEDNQPEEYQNCYELALPSPIPILPTEETKEEIIVKEETQNEETQLPIEPSLLTPTIDNQPEYQICYQLELPKPLPIAQEENKEENIQQVEQTITECPPIKENAQPICESPSGTPKTRKKEKQKTPKRNEEKQTTSPSISPLKNGTKEKTKLEIKDDSQVVTLRSNDIKSRYRGSTMSVQMAALPPPLRIVAPPISELRRLTTPPAPIQLAEGWGEYYDAESDSYYYKNSITGEKTKNKGIAMAPSTANNEKSSLSQTTSILREYPKLKTNSNSNNSNNSNSNHIEENDNLSPAKRKKSRRKSMIILSDPLDVKKERPSERKKRKGKDSSKSNETIDLSKAESLPYLPVNIQNEINKFKLTEYGTKYFQEHRKGIFRRLVPIKEMLSWSKEIIPTSMTRLPSEALSRDAVKIFKQIQIYMGDKLEKTNPIQVAQDIVSKGISTPELRDEIYCQLCKQTSFNPDPMSNKKGWELMILSVVYFPPTRDLESWLFDYLEEHLKIENEEMIYAMYCIKKLTVICKTGPRGRTPTTREIERHIIAPFSVSIFGVTIDEVMELQAKKHPNCELPVVVVKLFDAVIRLKGLTTEGIFRVPGDTEQVYTLRTQLDNGNYEVGPEINDPNTPASLIKLWLRELSEPLVPAELYQECIVCQTEEECVKILDKLPKVNRLIAEYVIEFLQKVSLEENQKYNKMSVNNLAMVFAPNFLRCPTEDSKIIFENTKYEQNWVKSLISSMRFGGDDHTRMVLD